MKLSIQEVARMVGASVPKNSGEVETLLTDSRSLENPSGSLFFAIPAKGNDGHRYVEGLYRKGVRNFVVERVPEGMGNVPDANLLVVPSSVKALQALGSRREGFDGEVVAITGSRGKTTLKEWLFQLLEPLADVSRSPRSYNSQIGVPLSMWEIGEDAGMAIIEAGVSRPGEMQALAGCIQADTVIFTNLLADHAEGFDSNEQKVSEKMLLAHGARVRTFIYNSGDALIAAAAAGLPGGVDKLSWSMDSTVKAPLQIIKTPLADGKVRLDWVFEGKSGSIEIRLQKDWDLENAAHALAFMLHKGLDAEVIAGRFASLHSVGTRLNVTEGVNGCSVIHDQYTSDLTSLRPALDFLRRRQTPGQSATLVLSDLHHEGSGIGNVYSRVADVIGTAGINRFIGVGRALMARASLFPEGSLFFENTSALLEALSPSDFNAEAILLKDSPEHDFTPLAEMLETRRHETVLEVNLDAIVRNYNYFRSKLPPATGIVCMVKASGYGAGSYEIAKTLQDAGAAYLAVAVLDEGVELRQRGITMPIMVMNPKVSNYKAMFSHRLEPEIYSLDMLRDVVREARKNGITDYPVHIKLDTGMHRMGFVREELPDLMELLGAFPEVRVKSVFSHLATADCPDMDDYTELQLSRFEEYSSYILDRCPYPVMRHVLNSAGILRYPQYHYNMARLGIGLYGANTLPPDMEEPLSVVSTLRTQIIAIREYGAGETVGYGRKGLLSRPSRIATVPIGYADGMNRRFGNGAVSVRVNGKDAPTVGNICMDACMIDVTGIECNVGDTVEIFGSELSLQRLADALGTIPYEILTSISPRVKRVYFRE